MKLDAMARYSRSHTWVRQDGTVFVYGITDRAQSELSDVVYVEMPRVGTSFAKGDSIGAIESVKADSDLNLPMGGIIVEVNDALENAADVINRDPYGAGWIVKFTATDLNEWNELLSAEEYGRISAAAND